MHTFPIPRLALVFLLCTIVAAGCSDQKDLKLRYTAEKKLHLVERQLQNAQIKRELGDPAVMKSLQDGFSDVSTYCLAAIDSLSPSSDRLLRAELEELAFQSTTRLSQFLFNGRSYDGCIRLLADFSKKISLPPLESAVIWVNIGQAYQAKGEWDSAVVVYNKALALTDPPLDQTGEVIFNVFNLPAHMYSIYSQIGDSIKAIESFNNAITYYRLFVERFAKTKLAVASHANLAALFTDRGNWREAIGEFGLLTDSTGQISWEARIRIGDVYAGKLQLYDSAIALYEGAASALAGPDTMMRPIVDFKKSLVYMMEKKYEEARRILTTINQNYPTYYASNPTAQLAKAKSFDDEGNWDRAESEYRFLIDNYAGSEEAMSTYLYLGEQFRKLGRTVEADRWNDRADTFYQQIADRNTGTITEARAMTFQAELKRRNSDWNGAVTKLLDLFHKFPAIEMGQRAAVAAAAITRDKLADSTRAEAIITELKRSLTDVAPPTQK
jgi:tetratricopeptide (TPR) repeat protein